MRNLILLLGIFFLTIPAGAQSAKVIPLSFADANEAKVRYTVLQDAQQDYDDFQKRMLDKYVPVGPVTFSYNGRVFRNGFENGFQFSEDFKFIVPKLGQTFYHDGCNYFLTPQVNPGILYLYTDMKTCKNTTNPIVPCINDVSDAIINEEPVTIIPAKKHPVKAN